MRREVTAEPGVVVARVAKPPVVLGKGLVAMAVPEAMAAPAARAVWVMKAWPAALAAEGAMPVSEEPAATSIQVEREV